MKTPNGCKTPAKTREEYELTAADLRYMTKAAKQIWDMLCYYSNMPENETGELTISGEKKDELHTALYDLIGDIHTAIGDVRYTD